MRPFMPADDMPADWPQGLRQPRQITRLHNPGPVPGRKAGTRLRSLAAARPARMRSDGLKGSAGLRREKRRPVSKAAGKSAVAV